MPSLRSPSSRQLDVGFPNDGPKNSGEHVARLFLGAPHGVKSEKYFPALTRNGVPYQERVVSYSMSSTFEGKTVVWWNKLRKTDFCDEEVVCPNTGDIRTIEGSYGDGSMERRMDAILAEAQATGYCPDIDIVAATDYITENNGVKKEHIAKDGRSFLA